MPVFRPAAERGLLDDPGLRGRAAFSHGGAFDPAWLGWGALRVLNQLELAPGAVLPAARRANMEVLGLVLSGRYRVGIPGEPAVEVPAGHWHRLGAGAGVDVVEANADAAQSLRLLQLWVQPARSNARPEQALAAPAVGQDRIAGPSTDPALLPWGAKARLRRVSVLPGGALAVPATFGDAAWVEVIGGELALGGRFLRGGDGLGLRDEPGLALVSSFGADLLLLEGLG